MPEQPSTDRLPGEVAAAAPAGAGATVHSVTTARKSLAQDQDERARRYLVSMAIRSLCFVVALFAPSPWRWFFVAGAVFLPYIAVVYANAVNVAPEGELEPAHGGALPGAAGPRPLADDDTPVHPAEQDLADHPDLHVGEVVAVRDH